MQLFKHTTPRWLVFIFDVCICCFSLFLSYNLRFNFSIPDIEWQFMPVAFLSLILVRIVSFAISKTYKGIIRHTGYKDSQRIFLTLLAGSAFVGFANLIAYRIAGRYLAPYSILIIDFISSVFLLTTLRIVVKSVYLELRRNTSNRTQVIIMGAGEEGLVVKHALERDAGINFKVIAFIDDNIKLRRRKLESVQVFHTESDLEDLLRANQVSSLIIPQKLSVERINQLIELCVRFNTKVQSVPAASNWVNGR